jgi:hypothetical protein
MTLVDAEPKDRDTWVNVFTGEAVEVVEVAYYDRIAANGDEPYVVWFADGKSQRLDYFRACYTKTGQRDDFQEQCHHALRIKEGF